VGQAGDEGVSLWEVSYTRLVPLLSHSVFHASPLLPSGSWSFRRCRVRGQTSQAADTPLVSSQRSGSHCPRRSRHY
jgi:hypothetical protein